MPFTQPQASIFTDYEILVNGSSLPESAQFHITGLTVDEEINLPNMFTLELGSLDVQKGEVLWLDNSLFTIGSTLEVKLGYRGNLTTLMVGEITAIEPEFTIQRLPKVMIRGYDRSHRLHRGRHTQTFVQLKDSDIAAQIAQQVGLSAQVEDSGVVHDYIFQANQTHMEFLQERAGKINYEVMVEDRNLVFRPTANQDSDILTLMFTDDLLEFYPCMSSASQVNEVKVQGWNPKEKQSIIGRATTGDEGSKMGGETSGAALSEDAFGTAVKTLSNHPMITQAEADQLAQARFKQLNLELISGEGICRGRTDLRAGIVVQIDGVGKRFSGQYYLTSVLHRYCNSQYHTKFTVRRNAQ
ncbi:MULTISPECIES: contractile injection system protein, VgrG/Pvc8 family [unclassified Moorena]|uniref:phage late control D family protein n=1 Tax=unclassified Moorena TaxID=2683338 RepID=UPI0013C92500|nr:MULTISPECIES: contractile injection system protein, VgrG/Pvc8 family [unclassified Moorena]NEO17964.1 phage late control D family protein [Moorena sp. SIO4A5]NEQ56269.1 phage late control D family protein [Moorena sp. SIO4A1]